MTLITVAVLFVAGGSLKRLREEADSGTTRVVNPLPRLADELLEAKQNLPVAPLAAFKATVAFAGDTGLTTRSAAFDGVLRPLDTAVDSVALIAASDGSARWGHGAYKPSEIWMPDRTHADDINKLVIVDNLDSTHPVVGSLGFSNLRADHLCLRVHLIWLHPAYLNDDLTAAQLVLFAALDALFKAHYRRIEFVVDVSDYARRRLARALGFELEGVLRKHMIVDERNRDSALYSLLNTDWKYSPATHKLATKLKYRRIPSPSAQETFPTPSPVSSKS